MAYQPVPVEAARQIGEQFAKQIVVIVAIDLLHDKNHFTTWGKRPPHKDLAAVLAETFSTALGAAPSTSQTFEDYRASSQAQWAADREKLVAKLNEAEATIAQLRKAADTSTP